MEMATINPDEAQVRTAFREAPTLGGFTTVVYHPGMAAMLGTRVAVAPIDTHFVETPAPPQYRSVHAQTWVFPRTALAFAALPVSG